MATDHAALFEPGRNCWRVERAERFHCIQDAAEHFRLVREAILAAKRSVFILGWDITAGVDLLPGAEDHELPTRLGELLDHVARRGRALNCYVLIWDYAAFYAIERDPFSRLRLGLGTHRRVRFRYDSQHPFGGSHHQKVVVVDDRLAFVGGIDLTSHRWDTSEHSLENPLRVNALGKPYDPYHEVQALVEGPAAAALGELARERWRRQGGGRLPPVAPAAGSLWPSGVPAELQDVDVAIARTEPPFGGRPGVRECEALFLDAFAAARRVIYIENQYFTNPRLADALAERLREPDGPEVIVVGPSECEGWLERKTMGELRRGALAQLRDADAHGRLRLYFPQASREREICTFVHSKTLIVDDELLRIGSANCSNRSMGLDTECDLAVLAGGDPERSAAIRQVRSRLVAEHLGVEPADVDRALQERGSLREAIDSLATGDRTLAPLQLDDPAADGDVSSLIEVADPERPMVVSQVVERLLPEMAAEDRRRRSLGWLVPACALAIVPLVGWSFFDPQGSFGLPDLQALLELAPRSGKALAAGAALFVAGGALFVPLELLVLLAVVVFGPLRGGALAVGGALLSSLAGHAAGRALGFERLGSVIGRRGYRLWRQLLGRGVVTVAVLRVVSITSASAIHLLCGAARMPVGEYLLGTLLGLLPAILTLGVLGALLRRTILEPSLLNAGATVGVALALALIALRVRNVLILRRMAPSTREHQERAAYG